MSVSLNCGPKELEKEPADISGRKFFYAGTYDIKDGKITHYLMNASDVHLIGKGFSRELNLKGDELILTGENQGQKFSAYWKKVQP